jgi:hypothetical protein
MLAVGQGGDRQRRFRQLLSLLPHRLGVRRLEARTDWPDYERFRGTGAAGD